MAMCLETSIIGRDSFNRATQDLQTIPQLWCYPTGSLLSFIIIKI